MKLITVISCIFSLAKRLPHLRALAQLIVSLFLGFHAVTWAGGDKGPGNRFEVGVGAQFAGTGGHLNFAIQRAPTETQAKERCLFCERILKDMQKELKKPRLSETQSAVLKEREGELWNLLISAIKTWPVAGETLLAPPEATPAPEPLAQDEALAEALKAVTLCSQCLEESLAAPSVQADAQLREMFEARRELALLKKKQLEQALQAPATEGGAVAETRTYWHRAYQAVQDRLQDPKEEAQELRNQALSAQATATNRYEYAMHLLTYQLCPPTDPDIVHHLFKAAQAGHEQAAFKLLEMKQFQAVCTKPSDSFFKLFQCQVQGQSPFEPEARTGFLAHAILAKNKPALKSLIQQCRADFKKGVDKSGDNPQWQALREHLNTLATEENEANRAYLKQLNQAVKASYRERKIEQIKQWLSDSKLLDPDVMSDDAEEAPNTPREQRENKQREEALQAELETTRTAKQEIEARLQALNAESQTYRLARQQSGEMKQKAMAALSHEKDALETALETTKQRQTDAEQTLAQLQAELESTRSAKQETESQLQALNDEYQAYRLARQESGELKKQTIEQLQTELDTAKQQTEAQLQTLNAEHQAYRLERQQSGEQKAQEIMALREQLAELQAEKAEQAPAERMTGQAYQLGQPGDPGFGVGAVPEGCLPPDFSPLPGSEEMDSDEYGNYRHAVAGMHVWIPAFVYRVGKQAEATLFQKYGAHTIEVQDFRVYLAGLDAPKRAGIIQRFVRRKSSSERAGLIAGLAQGQPGPEGWQLHRAFVNAGVVQAGFLMQKYLASKHSNGRSVTSVAGAVPLSLTSYDGYTRSTDMPGCAGELSDVYVLAKQTSDVHQVASIFQYSALTMLSLAQAQGARSNQYCAWWSADARGCCPKGCSQDLHDDQEVNLGWQSAGEPDDADKPLTGSCTDPAWASFNGQGSGVMDIKGALWEVAGAVTTGRDTDNAETFYALAREVDYIALDQDTAFGSQAQLQARGDEPVRLPYRVDRRLDGSFALFSGDGTYDALALPKSVDAKGLVWPGYDHSKLYTKYTYTGLMPIVGGSWKSGDAAGLCARRWHNDWDSNSAYAGLRLAAYGLTWTELAGASGALADSG